MTVEVVYTERRRDLTEARSRNYERLGERLADASGDTIAVSHYEDVDTMRLSRASAIVLSGSSEPWATRDDGELDHLGEAVVASGRPVLGICAGMQLLARFAGGKLGPGARAEHGFMPIDVLDGSDLLRDLPTQPVVFHDHTDEITSLPGGFRVLAASPECAIQAIACTTRRWWGTQFHPEEATAEHPAGLQVLRAFFTLARN